jgi:hypothetical protein
MRTAVVSFRGRRSTFAETMRDVWRVENCDPHSSSHVFVFVFDEAWTIFR